MSRTRAYAAQGPRSPLAPFEIDRREVGEHDLLVEIAFCGICHSDIHQARDEWGGALFPMVPGHEIVGRVTRAGAKVTRFRAGDTVGIGCLVDSCRTCDRCARGLEQHCAKGPAWTYNSTEMDRRTPTHGGYSKAIVVDQAFALRVAPDQDLSRVAPLLCAGITTWSPLRRWNVGKGKRVGVVGLGGLGHMAVKLAASLGAEVTVLSTSPAKAADARRLGAHEFAVWTEKGATRRLASRFDVVIDTVSAPHDLDRLLGTVGIDGALVQVGVPPEAEKVNANSLIGGRRSLAGSLIGGIAETQEVLDHCARHGIGADVEVVPIQEVNEAYERTLRSDVRYRFVIDLATL
ncbi:MAG TPA: NAD(P)-dependent alcohol dehydrogenase [Anaeromyxobacter sp.]